jgi:hypothetical protein
MHWNPLSTRQLFAFDAAPDLGAGVVAGVGQPPHMAEATASHLHGALNYNLHGVISALCTPKNEVSRVEQEMLLVRARIGKPGGAGMSHTETRHYGPGPGGGNRKTMMEYSRTSNPIPHHPHGHPGPPAATFGHSPAPVPAAPLAHLLRPHAEDIPSYIPSADQGTEWGEAVPL